MVKPWDPLEPFDTVPPRVLVASPEGRAYNSSSVPLVFSIVEASSSMCYSLNGAENVSITGNATLNGLANGAYNLTVYVTDRSGNVGASEVASFTVDAPVSFSAVAVAAVSSAVIVAVAAVAGLLLYLRKRKRKHTPF